MNLTHLLDGPPLLRIPFLRSIRLLLASLVIGALSPAAFAQPATPALGQELLQIRYRAHHDAQDLHRLDAVAASLPADAPYPLRRALLRARIAALSDTAGQTETLDAMQRLRTLAVAAGDADTVNLMDIQRIYMTHEDAAIDASLDAMHVVRARVTEHASLEVREALERSYGNMYFDAGNFDSALRHQLQALKLERDLPPRPVVAQLYRLGNIADLYIAMGLPQEALRNVARAEALGGTAMADANRLSLLVTKAMALRQLDRMDAATEALDAAEALARHSDSAFDRVRTAAAHTDMLLSLGKPARAMDAVAKVEAYAEANDSTYYRLRAQLLRGQALIDMGQAERGMTLMEQANAGFQAKGQMVDLLDGLGRQADALDHAGHPAQALAVARRLQDLRENLFRSEHARDVAELDAARKASDLAHRAEALATQNQLQDAQLRSERLSRWLAVAVALLAIAASVALYLLIRRTRGERDRLSHAIRHDPLTGAMSRYQFEQHAGLLPPVGGAAAIACVLLDLDHFKAVNDRHGHAAGDAVLQAVVDRMQQALGGAGELYRWGGEEFLLVLRGGDRTEIKARLQALVESMESRPVPWGSAEIGITASGGGVFHPLAEKGAARLSDAVRWADAAMYHAKSAGRRRIDLVELTDAGKVALHGRQPADLSQLLEWQQQGWVRLQTLGD